VKTILALSIVAAALGAAQCNKREESSATGTVSASATRPCESVMLGDTTMVVYASGDSVMTKDTLPRPRAASARRPTEQAKDTLPRPRSYLTCVTLYAKGDTLPRP
jgi:hypothetical protein